MIRKSRNFPALSAVIGPVDADGLNGVGLCLSPDQNIHALRRPVDISKQGPRLPQSGYR
jgi:hypothetical protein